MRMKSVGLVLAFIGISGAVIALIANAQAGNTMYSPMCVWAIIIQGIGLLLITFDS